MEFRRIPPDARGLMRAMLEEEAGAKGGQK